jgi:hypothetical protein
MKRCLAIALLVIAVVPADAQPIFCGSTAILPDEQHIVPGLKPASYALVSVYLSPDGVYDKPVVIPTPFDATEQTSDPVTPSKLFEEFSPFIVRVRVHTGTSTSYAPGIAFAAGRTYYAKVKSILDPSSTTAAAWSPTVAFTPGCVAPPSP